MAQRKGMQQRPAAEASVISMVKPAAVRKRRAGTGPVTEEHKAAFVAGRERALAARRVRIAERKKRDAEAGVESKTRYTMLLEGELTVQDLDDDELARKQCRNREGNFIGRPPELSRKMYSLFQSELLRRGEGEFSKFGKRAIGVVAELAFSKYTDEAVRLRAANILIERVYGKVPEVIRAIVANKWDETVEEVITIMDDEQAAG